MGCYGSFSNNNYDGRFLFYFFKKENNETELCGYVVVLFYISHDNHEYVKWIRRKFCWKCNSFKYCLLVFLSKQFCDKCNDDFCGDIVEWNSGRIDCDSGNNELQEVLTEISEYMH